MNKILEKVNENIENGDKLLIGVSGGVDSMVLLHSVLALSNIKKFSFKVNHIEHGIRGEASKADADFVKNYCHKNNIEVEVISANVPQLAKETKSTIEECARTFRYNVMLKNVEKHGKIFVAHHKNDQAETVLMHIFRGSGVDGASGIRVNGNIYRPLIDISKQEILDYAREFNVEYRQDDTNNDNNYSRNFLRNEIIAKATKIYPNIVDNICKFANFCQEYSDFVDSKFDNNWVIKDKNIVKIYKQVFLEHSCILAKAIKTAYNLCGEYADLESKHYQIIKNLYLQCKNGTTCNLAHSIVCEKRDDYLLMYKQSHKISNDAIFKLGENLLPNNKTIFVKKVDDCEFVDGKYYIDYHKVGPNSVWRTRKENDTFAKLGSGKKKLNDYFTDKKIPAAMRDNIILLADGNKILLVLGYDISDNVKVKDDTLQILEVDYSNLVL